MRLNTAIHWLRILLALAMTPLITTKIFAAERTLVTEEHVVQTRNGCNTRIHFNVDSKFPISKKIFEFFKNDIAESDWDGECVNGVTTGAGKLIKYILGNPATYTEGVHLNGSAVGLSKAYTAKGDGLDIIEYAWNGTVYKQLNLHRRSLAPRTEWNGPVLVKDTPTEGIVVSLLQDAAPGERGRCGKQSEVMSCVKYAHTVFKPCADRSLAKCKAWDDEKETIYPCSNDCLQKWNQFAQPLLAEYQTFVEQTKPELDAAVNAAMAQVSAARAEKNRQQEKLAEQASRNTAKAARVQQALNDANQLRRPVASPNLDALIKKIKSTKP